MNTIQIFLEKYPKTIFYAMMYYSAPQIDIPLLIFLSGYVYIFAQPNSQSNPTQSTKFGLVWIFALVSSKIGKPAMHELHRRIQVQVRGALAYLKNKNKHLLSYIICILPPWKYNFVPQFFQFQQNNNKFKI